MSNFEIINKKIPGADIVAQIITDDLPAPSVPRGAILLIERNPTAENSDIVLVKERETNEHTICSLFIEGNTISLRWVDEDLSKFIAIDRIHREDFDQKYEIIGKAFEIRIPLSEEWEEDYMTPVELELWRSIKYLTDLPEEDWQQRRDKVLQYKPGDIIPGAGELSESTLDFLHKFNKCVDNMRSNAPD